LHTAEVLIYVPDFESRHETAPYSAGCACAEGARSL